MDKAFGDSQKTAEGFANATKDIGKSAEAAGKGAEKRSKSLGQFAQSLFRIAKYRLIRSALREITQGFREGLQNAYQFSKGIGGDLAKAMDSLSTKSLTMKNQLGAAFGALLTNVMPVLIKIIELVTRAANAITQFFAALGGRTQYKKAVDSTQTFAENLSAGASSAKELRRQLMSFDEINRLDAPSPSSGGGGGASAVDYGDMFEMTDLDAWTEKVAKIRDRLVELWDTIKNAFTKAWNFIKDHFDFEETFNDVCDVIQGATQFITGILSGDWKMAFEGAALAIQGLGNIAIRFLSYLQDVGNGFFDWIRDSINAGLTWLEQKTGYSFETLRTTLLGLVEAARQLFNGLFDSMKQILKGIVDFIAGVFTLDMRRVWNGIVEMIKGVLNAAVTLVEAKINAIIGALNVFLGFVQNVIRMFGGNVSLQLQNVHLPRFATGGFPEDGLFMANHSEMVGQFSNGQTAVANNEQIIEGIKRGVVEAMLMVDSSKDKQGGSTTLNINGREFFRAVWSDYRAVAREHGVTLVNAQGG